MILEPLFIFTYVGYVYVFDLYVWIILNISSHMDMKVYLILSCHSYMAVILLGSPRDETEK